MYAPVVAAAAVRVEKPSLSLYKYFYCYIVFLSLFSLLQVVRDVQQPSGTQP